MFFDMYTGPTVWDIVHNEYECLQIPPSHESAVVVEDISSPAPEPAHQSYLPLKSNNRHHLTQWNTYVPVKTLCRVTMVSVFGSTIYFLVLLQIFFFSKFAAQIQAFLSVNVKWRKTRLINIHIVRGIWLCEAKTKKRDHKAVFLPKKAICNGYVYVFWWSESTCILSTSFVCLKKCF